MWNFIFGDDDDASSTSSEVSFPAPSHQDSGLGSIMQPPTTTLVHNSPPPSTVIKHRIPSPIRQAGDGMEESRHDKSQKVDSHPIEAVPAKKSIGAKIRLPLTNISLDKLPPISDDGFRLPEPSPSTPLFKMALGHPQRSGSSFHKTKEPKFVPYEPYKAAITPLVIGKKNRKRQDQPKSRSETPEQIRKDSEQVSDDEESLKKIQDFNQVQVVDSRVTCDNETPVTVENPESESLKKVVKEREAQIEELRKGLAEAEKQLRIQTQVNSEVKKLLVASVGEDIEAKVDFLTQDKARLAADMRQFSYQISKDFEEKEKLSVQSDVWKSKFLACSVIVDELARWKGMLIQHQDDTDHYIRLLFHERNVLWNSLIETQTTLEKLKTAFDPLGVLSSPTSGKTSPKLAQAASVLGMADSNVVIARELHDRLLGDTKLKTGVDSNLKIRLLDTPAEEGLREALSNTVESPAGYSDLASVAVTGAAKPHLMKMGDKLATPTSYKCCTHCQGNIHIV